VTTAADARTAIQAPKAKVEVGATAKRDVNKEQSFKGDGDEVDESEW